MLPYCYDFSHVALLSAMKRMLLECYQLLAYCQYWHADGIGPAQRPTTKWDSFARSSEAEARPLWNEIIAYLPRYSHIEALRVTSPRPISRSPLQDQSSVAVNLQEYFSSWPERTSRAHTYALGASECSQAFWAGGGGPGRPDSTPHGCRGGKRKARTLRDTLSAWYNEFEMATAYDRG